MERVPLNEHAAEQPQQRSRRRLEDETLAAQSAQSRDGGAVTADPDLPELRTGAGVTRATRKPFGGFEQRLSFPKRPGYHSHWFNDEPGRLERAGLAGYEHRKDAAGRTVSTVVGISRGGGALTAYLMDIPIEWYAEDMAAQEAHVLETKRQIQTGQFEMPGRDEDARARYAGSNTMGGISIREGARR